MEIVDQLTYLCHKVATINLEIHIPDLAQKNSYFLAPDHYL